MTGKSATISAAMAPVWPEGRHSAVALAFDVDGPTGDAMLDGSLLSNPRYFTQGAYGPWRALPRLLDLLGAYGLTATFFVPTWVVVHWTDICERILREGCEIAYHGHRHEVFIDCTRQQQLDIMERSRAIFRKRLGVTPVGFRTPSGDWSEETAALLRDFGVIYSSSMRGDDRPYFHQGARAAAWSRFRRDGISMTTPRWPTPRSRTSPSVSTGFPTTARSSATGAPNSRATIAKDSAGRPSCTRRSAPSRGASAYWKGFSAITAHGDTVWTRTATTSPNGGSSNSRRTPHDDRSLRTFGPKARAARRSFR